MLPACVQQDDDIDMSQPVLNLEVRLSYIATRGEDVLPWGPPKAVSSTWATRQQSWPSGLLWRVTNLLCSVCRMS